ncbi:hypothetical protein [Sphingomonas radiodurans]|uniref:hypothetical protein n=1 Tax=Sphingomonas radiodurans TaxID=2890321 RepID=UPI001E2BAA2E|nr:hypothetical protein [Sphingomonas radiodurans]WBH15285.1 hypothetical protein LLW23_10545 [Sphingomonas radiodurans]
MLTLNDRGALRGAIRDPSLDPRVRAVLRLRFDQLGGTGAAFHVVGNADLVADAEAAVGFPMTLDGEPCWEWLERHPGGITEIVFVLSDDGPAQVLLVPGNADPSITSLLQEHADG